MTRQKFMSSSSSSLLSSVSSQSQPTQVAEAQISETPYQADHQAEFLHLQADTDALLAQLKALKYKKLTLSDIGAIDTTPNPAAS
jgi:hypothetical protein